MPTSDNKKEKKSGYSIYDSGYYTGYCCGDHTQDYRDAAYWYPCFRKIAEQIVDSYAPKTFLDVGCAFGYLVAALRDLGVEAYGIDVSNYAISQVREDIKPYCAACEIQSGRLPDSFPKRFDAVSIIEVIEHIDEESTQDVIKQLCALSDLVLFSSSPDAVDEPTHFNVQQPEYWAKRFSYYGFYRNTTSDCGFISPNAILFAKENVELPQKLVEKYERYTRQIRKKSQTFEQQCVELWKIKADYEAALPDLQAKVQEYEKKERLLQSQREDQIHESISELTQEIRQQLLEKTKNQETQAALRAYYENIINNRNAHEIQLEQTLNAVTNSFFWRLTYPMRYLVSGVRKRLHPSQVPQGTSKPVASVCVPAPTLPQNQTVRQYLDNRFFIAQPIPRVLLQNGPRRLNIVVDGIDEGNLLGGVATALIVATEFANRQDIPLRIITRLKNVNPIHYQTFMQINGMQPAKTVEYYSDYDRDQSGTKSFKLEVSENDIFLATSWWSAKAIERTSLRKRFYYIIQEVETFFYPHGDDHLYCSQVMQNPNIDFIVNSKYLWDYFSKTAPNIVEHGVYFEPAFSETLYQMKALRPKKKHRLFFYSRPNNPRNLFAYGLQLLDYAISTGVLNTKEWEICFVGQNVPEIQFCDGTLPTCMGALTWKEYSEFLNETDLAVSLMYTPHPSYPPFDVAASGGVVVTNACLNKKDFNYCENVLVADLEPERFAQKLAEGIELAKNLEQRTENYHKSTIRRDWHTTLLETIKYMEEAL